MLKFMGNYLEAPLTEKATILYETSNNVASASCSMQGWRAYMEDRVIAHTHIENLPDHMLFGVFDGHGGDEVAEYCKQNFLCFMEDEIRKRPNPSAIDELKEIMRRTYLRLDVAVKEVLFDEQGNLMHPSKRDPLDVNCPYEGSIEQSSQDTLTLLEKFEEIENEIGATEEHHRRRTSVTLLPPSEEVNPGTIRMTCGSTAVTVLITPTHIMTCNTGDSRCVLAREGTSRPLSFDHKPNMMKEKKRIETAGGSVIRNRVNGKLALSRCIGDHSFKLNSSLPPELQMVSYEPDITVIPRSQSDEFLLLACDGLWDVLANDESTSIVRQYISQGEKDLGTILEALVDKSLSKQSRDNISSVLVVFPPAWTADFQIHISARYILDWAVDDVLQWLFLNNFSEYQEAFRIAAIDGSQLLELSEQDLVSKLRLKKVGLRKNLWQKLSPLRLGYVGWSMEEMTGWLSFHSFSAFEALFRENGVDGSKLQLMSSDDIRHLCSDRINASRVEELLHKINSLKDSGQGGNILEVAKHIPSREHRASLSVKSRDSLDKAVERSFQQIQESLVDVKEGVKPSASHGHHRGTSHNSVNSVMRDRGSGKYRKSFMGAMQGISLQNFHSTMNREDDTKLPPHDVMKGESDKESWQNDDDDLEGKSIVKQRRKPAGCLIH